VLVAGRTTGCALSVKGGRRVEPGGARLLVGAATITSAVLFALVTRVDWAAVGPLAAGLFCGSLAGPWVARRMPPAVLRWLVALTGLALAVHLWPDPAG
jgi:uncharacterized protein